MRLISAHVSCFGGLEDFSIDFSEGMTVILERNGRGKSTFAAFIKAMFYGLPVTKIQDLSKNERRKYIPWSGRNFGGSLVFEEGGKRYRIERTFDPKNGRNDSFRLTDAESGMPSDDYDRDVGLQIFGINSAAFARCVFISRGDFELSDDESAKSMTAKLNGISEEPEDLDKYDKAMKSLDERRRYYQATGNRGEIPRIKEKIASLNNELEVRLEDERQAAALKTELDALEKDTAARRAEYAETDRLIRKAAGARAAREAKENYARALERYEKEKKACDAHLAFFKNGIPDRGRIETLKEELSEIPVLDLTVEKQYESYYARGKELEETFKDGKPEISEVSSVLNDLRSAKITLGAIRLPTDEEREELEKLENLIAGRAPDDDELDEYSRSFSELEALERSNAARPAAPAPGTKKKNHYIPAIAGVICMIAGMILALTLGARMPLLVTGIAIALTGAALIAAALLIFIKNYVNERTAGTAAAPDHDLLVREAELRLTLGKFYSDYPFEKGREPMEALSDLRAKVVAYRGLRSGKENSDGMRSAALERLKAAESEAERILEGFSLSGDTTEMRLEVLIDQLKDYDDHVPAAKKQIAESQKAAQRKAEILSGAESFIALYPVSSQGIAALTGILERLTAYENSQNALGAAKAELDRFMRDAGDLINSPDEPDGAYRDTGELEAKLDSLGAEIESARTAVGRLKSRMERLTDSADMIPDVSARLQEENERLEHCEYRLKVIQTAMLAMESAKNDLSTRYLGSIRRGFAEYCRLLSPELLDGCEIDASLNISRSENGLMRDSGYYSSGTRDMMELCAKLAVSDALFDGDASFVILDDPLVNLDGENLERMKGMISKLADSRQIIYLTCHESRVPSV